MKKAVVFVFMIVSIKISASDCRRISKIEVYETADLVFLGQVSEIDDSTFGINVFEYFKGSEEIQYLKGIRMDNSISPKEEDLWLFYAKQIGEGEVYIDFCSGSKSFQNPTGFHDVTFPSPPPPFLKDQSLLFLTENIVESKSLSELYFEIISLRQMKIEKLINEKVDDKRDGDFQFTVKRYFYLSLGIILPLFVTVIIMGGIIIRRMPKR